MDNGYSPLRDDEVLFVDRGRVLMTNPTFKVIEFLDALAQAISDREDDWSEDNEAWFGDGLPCEALRFGTGGWQRGRVRIRLEFVPEKIPGKLPERSSASRPSEQPLERMRSKSSDTFYQDSEDDRY
ncbi:MAG: KGK domain-containing protein [Leptolyngbyaceae cyanobacterium CSU_1_3]|nr:KGK domain-containing protein [Leptolyngbyaceae cyanobacterium CSU_1_3]